MAYPMGEAKLEPLRVDFDRRLKLEFHGSDISSDGGLFPYRELDHALELSELGGEVLSETRRGKNTRHLLVGLLRQSVFGRLAGYEDVNDAERLSHDPVMRAIVDRKGLRGRFILSLNDVPEVRQLFAGFRIEALETTYTIAGGRGAKRSTELLITGP